jgi:hypothetical protein
MQQNDPSIEPLAAKSSGHYYSDNSDIDNGSDDSDIGVEHGKLGDSEAGGNNFKHVCHQVCQLFDGLKFS